MKLIIHTDGGARGNPGPAAIGVVIEKVSDQGSSQIKSGHSEDIARIGKAIGNTTNNVAEYTAVIEAMECIRNFIRDGKLPGNGHLELECYLDSTLVVNQLNGLFKVKDAKLRSLLMQVRVLEQDVGGQTTYHTIPRELNHRADLLVNQALDSLLMSG